MSHPMHRRHVLSLAAGAALLPVAGRVSAAEPEIFAPDGIAIHGIDPIGYFETAAPVTGAVPLSWRGAEWRFADEASRMAFEAEPEKWAPAFGGWCAYAASLGILAPTIPEAWYVHEGRLFLNRTLRAQELWLQDLEANIVKGDANWPGILG